MPNKPSISDEDVLELVHRVMHQFRHQQFQVLRDGPYSITHMESKVLGFFARRPGATQRDLAEHSGRDKAQLARLVKALKEQGLLTGEVDEADRRNVHLHLSQAGVAVQEALRKQGQRLSEQAMDGLSAAERKQLRALLLQMTRNLDGPRDS